MYRVELKVLFMVHGRKKFFNVPNVPCGVESIFTDSLHIIAQKLFLMYRVELKVWI